MSDTQVIIVVCIIALVQGVMLFYFMEKCVKQEKQLKTLRAFLLRKYEDIENKLKEIDQTIEDINRKQPPILDKFKNMYSKN